MSRTVNADTGLRNRLRGILGVASVWTTAPTNLERCTDGNWGNMTGEGSKNIAPYTEAGQVDFDMGGIYDVHVRAKLRLKNAAAGNVELKVWGSEDGGTYYLCQCPGWDVAANFSAGVYLGAGASVDIYVDFFIRGRYLRLGWFSGAGASVISGAVWEIEAIDLGIG